MKYKYFYSLNSKSFCIQKLKPSTTQFSIHKKTVPVRERAYNDLKSDLLSGRFAPGERLTEEHLAKSLGVSRTPVREALHKLESEGLVKPLESRGFYVALDSREELEDLFDIRAALEGYAIRLICEKISEETIGQLNEFILKTEDAFARKQLDEIFEYNTQFHDTLHNVLSSKTRFHTLIADIRKYVLRYRKDSLHYLDGARRTIDGHKKILMAIRLKDSELCERVMREHVREAKEEALLRYFPKRNDDR
jgi:DNA-binding GntR family transcriptional regulator